MISNYSKKKNNNNEKELKTLTQTMRIYSQVIGIKSGIEKCAMLIMESWKREITKELNCQIKKAFERLEKRIFISI